MIQAKDLRIGNLYKGASRGNIEIATGQTIAQIEEGKLNALPVELTPEILEAAGFEKSLGTIWWEETEKLPINEVDKKFYYSIDLSYDGSDWVKVCQIKYVHQLQNLYHSLTGEELKIELPTTGKEL